MEMSGYNCMLGMSQCSGDAAADGYCEPCIEESGRLAHEEARMRQPYSCPSCFECHFLNDAVCACGAFPPWQAQTAACDRCYAVGILDWGMCRACFERDNTVHHFSLAACAGCGGYGEFGNLCPSCDLPHDGYGLILGVYEEFSACSECGERVKPTRKRRHCRGGYVVEAESHTFPGVAPHV